MARLPQVSRRLAVTPQVESSISGADVATPYRMVAQSIENVGAGLKNYQDAVDAGYLARHRPEVIRLSDNVKAEVRGDPIAYDKAMADGRRAMMVNAPRHLRDSISLMVDTEAAYGRRDLMRAKLRADIATAQGGIEAERDRLYGEAARMAHAGETGTDEFARTIAEWGDLTDALAGNQEFPFSPADAARDRAVVERALQKEGVLGDIERTYSESGEEAALRRAEELSSALDLTPEEQRSLHAGAITRIRQLSAADDAVAQEEEQSDRVGRQEAEKTGYDLMRADQMSEEWLDAHRDDLSVASYRTFSRSVGDMVAGPARRTDPAEFVDMLRLAESEPEEARLQAREAYAEGRLAKDDFQRLERMTDSSGVAGQRQSAAKEVRSYVSRTLSPGRKAEREDNQRFVETMLGFDDWVEQNPEATALEIKKHADELVDGEQKAFKVRLRQRTPIPRFLGVADPDAAGPNDITRGQALLKKALVEGLIDEDDAANEATLLEDWSRIVGAGNGGG